MARRGGIEHVCEACSKVSMHNAPHTGGHEMDLPAWTSVLPDRLELISDACIQEARHVLLRSLAQHALKCLGGMR
eukprot:29996-Chlamydomonas_euryale.AAC.1